MIRISVPFRASDRSIRQFLLNHERWLSAQYSAWKSNQLPAHQIWFEGRLVEWDIAPIPEMIINFDRITVPVIPGKSDQDSLSEAFKKRAKPLIYKHVTEFARRFGETDVRPRMASAQKRWGSCSNTRTVSINWRLIMAPPAVLEYVIIHEICHLRELNHSPAFWALVQQRCPEYRTHIHWLNQHGQQLLSI